MMILIRNLLLTFTISTQLCATQELAVESGTCHWLNDYLTLVYTKGAIHFWYGNLLKDPQGFRKVVDTFAARYSEYQLDAIVAVDKGGLLFASALAYELNIPLVLAAHPGYLPRQLESHPLLEIEVQSIQPGWIVLVMDDMLGTGVHAKVACDLVEKFGCMAVEVASLIEQKSLNGREILDRPVFSLLIVP